MYTIKEINAVAGCHTFGTAAICDPCLFYQVHDVWSKAFINTEVLFSANKCSKQGICVFTNIIYLSHNVL